MLDEPIINYKYPLPSSAAMHVKRVHVPFPWEYHLARTTGRVRVATLGIYTGMHSFVGMLHIPRAPRRAFVPLTSPERYSDTPSLTPGLRSIGGPSLSGGFLIPHRAKWCDCVAVIAADGCTIEMISSAAAAESLKGTSGKQCF